MKIIILSPKIIFFVLFICATSGCKQRNKSANNDVATSNAIQQPKHTLPKEPYCKPVKGLELTKADNAICVISKIQKAYGQCMKMLSKNQLKLAPAVGEFGDLLKRSDSMAICSLLPSESDIFDLLPNMKEQFRENGLLLFVCSDDANKDYLTAIRGNDEIDIIKWRKTNAGNFGYDNHKLLTRLEQWNFSYGINILDAGMDFVWVRFNKMPDDMDSFAKEVYKFCPDIVDQGTGDLKTLKEELIEMHGVFLWWD